MNEKEKRLMNVIKQLAIELKKICDSNLSLQSKKIRLRIIAVDLMAIVEEI